ncbi:MAG: autoinducer binding domain-containing protein [Pseudomonadota bacterium]
MWNGTLTDGASTGLLSAKSDATFYERIAETSSVTGKLELLWGVAQNLGFTDIFYCKLEDPLAESPYHSSNVRDYRFGDETWHSLYQGQNYGRFDWAIERATWERNWFRLDEPPCNLSGNQERFLTHAREYNRQNGFCFPLNNSAGLHGGFSATGCDRPVTQAQIMQMTSALQLAELTMKAESQKQILATYGLNEREMRDLRMLAAGRSMSQIAHITGKSHQWIRLSFSQIRGKLGVSSNTQLVYRAAKMGII